MIFESLFFWSNFSFKRVFYQETSKNVESNFIQISLYILSKTEKEQKITLCNWHLLLFFLLLSCLNPSLILTKPIPDKKNGAAAHA